jgi:uncharacterized membrane protein
MSREQTIARFYFACLAIFAIVYIIGWRVAGLNRFTVALFTATIVWTIGFAVISLLFHWRSTREVVEDERDRLISMKATIAGGATGYMVFFSGIVFIHHRFAMNGVFTVPVDTMYHLFAIVMLVFATIRELAIVIAYTSGSKEPSR